MMAENGIKREINLHESDSDISIDEDELIADYERAGNNTTDTYYVKIYRINVFKGKIA